MKTLSRLKLTELDAGWTPERLPPSLFELSYFFLLESSLPGRGRYSIAASDPCFVIQTADPFPALREALAKYPVQSCSDLPFSGGWIGYLGYEAYSLLHPKVPSRPPSLINPACFGFYDSFYVYDHLEKRAWLAALEPRISGRPGIEARLSGPVPLAKREEVSAAGGLIRFESSLSKKEYFKAVRRIHDYIVAGDCYQVNLSRRLQTETKQGAPFLYERLRQVSPAPYSAFLNIGSAHILSSSPESFLDIEGQNVATRPIKGTRRRGHTPDEDERLRRELEKSAKDKAELLMITDLERNDLGQVCRPGSVEVPSLQKLETFPQVHHLVSTVTGRLLPDKDALDVLRAVFPGGSVTGAPKIRAMQIIRELEPHPRDVYCGAIGYLSLDGRSQWNIAIRTMILHKGHAYFYAGGGIVADSDPESEYEETLNKSRAFFEILANVHGFEEVTS